MLAHCLRRWPNNKTALIEHRVCAWCQYCSSDQDIYGMHVWHCVSLTGDNASYDHKYQGINTPWPDLRVGHLLSVTWSPTLTHRYICVLTKLTGRMGIIT